MRKSIQEQVQQGDRFFHWRGGAVSRMESLFDAVIALALTLIIVTVEVPNQFSDLALAFKKLPAFGICFAILIMCWYYHFQFHRRYGLEDFPVAVMNGVLMFLVLFYVYPLKFLYTFLLADAANAPLEPGQMTTLMVMYSGGFGAIFLCLLLMHAYAFYRGRDLQLTANEWILSKMKLCELGWYVAIAVVSIVLAFTGRWPVAAGLVYILIGPIQFLSGLYWGRYVHED